MEGMPPSFCFKVKPDWKKKMLNDKGYEEKFKRLVEIMDTLRGKEGCPWDLEQDHKTLMPYLIEEAFEVIEAIEDGSDEKLCEELGDLLLQIVFHARISKENNKFHIGDVIDSISEKLIRRHPHIFSTTKVKNAKEVLKNWEEIKLKEKSTKRRTSLLDGIPKSMPALLYARRIQERAAGVGFDWEDIEGVLDKSVEEIGELKEALDQKDGEKVKDELGDLLFALVNIARWMDINPEEALRSTGKKFIRRFRHIETEANKEDRDLSEMGLYEMEEIWQNSKKFE